MNRLPAWMRRPLTTDEAYKNVHTLIGQQTLHTVCESAKCPNRSECWNRGTATIMVLGNICTRSCRFCSVPSGKPLPLDADEPRRVAEAVKAMSLKHIVLTSVDRDDLPDEGSRQFAATVRAIRLENPDTAVEVLTPDFSGSESALDLILEAVPQVFSHNLETVARLQPVMRSQASYGRSLGVLAHAAKHRPHIAIKSGLMLGLGETDEELLEAMADLREAGCEILTLGQYLKPTRNHAPVERYVTPAEFDTFAEEATRLGFSGVTAGPMVRSSYKAEELLAQTGTACGFPV